MTRTPVSGRAALTAAGVGIVYALLAKLSAVVVANGVADGAVFWPGAGVTVAALLLLPRRQWPAVLGAVAVAEIIVDLSEGFAASVALAWAVANTIEPLIAAALLTRGDRPAPRFTRRGEVWRFTGIAVLLAPAIGAFVGTATAVLLVGDPWLPRLPRWWVGDAIGVLVVAPALLASRRRLDRRQRRWAVGGGALALAVTAVAMWPWSFEGSIGLPFLVLPALLVVAARGGSRAVAISVLGVALLTDVVTATGHGPFIEDAANGGVVAAQLFVAMTAFAALKQAALTDDLVTREELDAVLRQQALQDGLTGLANRRLLFDRLDRHLAGLPRAGSPVAVIYIDLDDFKGLNDQYGHAAGDAALIDAARRLEHAVRPTDTVARVGGDELVVLVPEAEAASIDKLITRVRAAMSEPCEHDGQLIALTASIGVAFAEPGRPVSASELLSRADAAMYREKQSRTRRRVVELRQPQDSPDEVRRS